MDSSNLQSWAFGGSSDAWSDKRVEAGSIPWRHSSTCTFRLDNSESNVIVPYRWIQSKR